MAEEQPKKEADKDGLLGVITDPPGMTPEQARAEIFKSIAQRYQLMHLGDTNHKDPELRKALREDKELWTNIKEAGFKSAFLEHPQINQDQIIKTMQNLAEGDVLTKFLLGPESGGLLENFSGLNVFAADPHTGVAELSAACHIMSVHSVEMVDVSDPAQAAGLSLLYFSQGVTSEKNEEIKKQFCERMAKKTDKSPEECMAMLKELEDINNQSANQKEAIEKFKNAPLFKALAEYGIAHPKEIKAELINDYNNKVFEKLKDKEFEGLAHYGLPDFRGNPEKGKNSYTALVLNCDEKEAARLWEAASKDPEAEEELKNRFKQALTGLSDEDVKKRFLKAYEIRIGDQDLADFIAEKLSDPKNVPAVMIYGDGHGSGPDDYNEKAKVPCLKVSFYNKIEDYLGAGEKKDKPELVYIASEKKFYTTEETPKEFIDDLKEKGFKVEEIPDFQVSQLKLSEMIDLRLNTIEGYCENPIVKDMTTEYRNKLSEIDKGEGTEAEKNLKIAQATLEYAVTAKTALSLYSPQEKLFEEPAFDDFEKMAKFLEKNPDREKWNDHNKPFNEDESTLVVPVDKSQPEPEHSGQKSVQVNSGPR